MEMKLLIEVVPSLEFYSTLVSQNYKDMVFDKNWAERRDKTIY